VGVCDPGDGADGDVVTVACQLGLLTDAIAWEYRAAPADMTGGRPVLTPLRDESREAMRPWLPVLVGRALSFKSCVA
jgi:hypothetical protein